MALVPQKQYFDKYILIKNGVQVDANLEVKRKLGFAAEQKFSRLMTDAVALVASTSVGDDCGEGFAPASAWTNAFSLMQAPGQPARD